MLWFLLVGYVPGMMASLLYVDSDSKCVRELCPGADYFHYYNCNGSRCDFHLQPWLFAVVALIVISFLLSVVCTLLNCICCTDRR
ncbi:unnamed protein product [Bursaphelenchus xylophilus]|uniref:(pine wood nematode) hypothetical protein n=1 Tax=Bursaphelenchus xylophilus TaxID=6326 RepID=A0A1I7RY70_BURXY|nr:unnamed protein product [Bursaphelenchus xylophilus]CAG9085368.1 unnamed protein product [Bursaphelenchus xylophilus]